jgi:hypothetical protein
VRVPSPLAGEGVGAERRRMRGRLSLPGGEGGLGREPEPGGVDHAAARDVPTPARSSGATRPSPPGRGGARTRRPSPVRGGHHAGSKSGPDPKSLPSGLTQGGSGMPVLRPSCRALCQGWVHRSLPTSRGGLFDPGRGTLKGWADGSARSPGYRNRDRGTRPRLRQRCPVSTAVPPPETSARFIGIKAGIVNPSPSWPSSGLTRGLARPSTKDAPNARPLTLRPRVDVDGRAKPGHDAGGRMLGRRPARRGSPAPHA